MLTAELLLAYILSTASVVGIDVDTSKIDPEQAYCLAQNIYYEAKSESKQGQIAVASVTLNRANDSRFPDTICEVVQQSAISKYSKKLVCAFTWYCEQYKKGKEIPVTNKDGTVNEAVYKQFEAASIIAIGALSGNLKDNTHGATHFYNPSIAQPSWAAELKRTVRLGNHDFHKLPQKR
jgi:N-acetylmuramoyl-L-alanine amidase